MTKVRAALLSAAVAAVTLLSVAPAASAAAHASAKARTCAAFSAWEKHRTAGHLDAMMTGSLGVPWKYLGEDADQLYRDVRGGKTQYIAGDEKYLREDCR